eukprot:TRINITY_DN67231_c0_g1_i1.p1 TRINITY_DN67231_c0_g1~~TRINITY_DN67231_c0_g1_i1.p1  ORF type:complete len:893 (+),score=56.38 TRINITY_DN67231_c0_g1_i1:51-2681(+)
MIRNFLHSNSIKGRVTYFLLATLLLISSVAKAQLPTSAAAYPFVPSNKAFNYLSGGTAVTTFGSWDDGYVTGIPIGFPFTFCGVTYNDVTAHTNGYMCFGANTNMWLSYSTTALGYTAPAVFAMWHDGSGSSASATPVSYLTTGIAPNRVFTLEFRNWGSFPYSSAVVTYQYKLYEGGAVEIHYKPEAGTWPSTAAIGIGKNSTDFQCLPNTSAAPTPNTATMVAASGSTPVAGQSYLWGLIPCTGTPSYSITGPTIACAGKPFSVTLSGTGIISGLTFLWEYSNDGITWLPYTGTGAGSNAITDVITTAPRWYRSTITCTNSGLTYTSAAWKVDVAPFYYCYCDVAPTTATGLDIGNVTMLNIGRGDTALNNGNSTPLLNNTSANKAYSNFQYSPNQPVVMYRNPGINKFRMFITEINSTATFTPGYVGVFIDFDRNGTFDLGERVLTRNINGGSLIPSTESDTFSVPATAKVGLTGMRIVLSSSNVDSCGNGMSQGEVEDYLVDMRYEPCSGPVSAGTLGSTSTMLCSGYDYITNNSGYDSTKSETLRSWMVSGDNIVWSPIANSTSKDTLMRVFSGQPLYYKVRNICMATKDTSFSTPLKIDARPGYKCYCYSQAIGGNPKNSMNPLDSSDIGGIEFSTFNTNSGGAHLLNVGAQEKRTDHTDDAPLLLDVDSTYKLTVYHTQRTAVHADAKITVFMDFNNNKEYDIPYERVYTGYTSVGNFTIVDNITIPNKVITDLPTGMRIILNNDMTPNVPSDQACGPYTSGETEDLMVMFQRKFAASVNTLGSIEDFGLYPNPTTGKFRLQFNSAVALNDVTINITSITGQLVMQKVVKHEGGTFTQDLDMSNQARGVYVVELRSADGAKQVQRLVID